MSAGLDTGFFVRLLQQSSTAVEVWGQITRRERSSVLSCISRYELDKHGLKQGGSGGVDGEWVPGALR